MSIPKPPSQLNFNTLMTTIALVVILWVGNKTASNNDALTKIETQLPYVNASVVKLESQIGQLVTRSEMESRFAEAQTKLSVFDKRLILLEFDKKKPAEP